MYIEAACACNKGKVRENNEDNLYINGKCLEPGNTGIKNTVYAQSPLDTELCYAVFDGMGGENYGEYASFRAAKELQTAMKEHSEYIVSEKEFLTKLIERLNSAVVVEKKNKMTSHMGTTVSILYFSGRTVYSCNLGDTRCYRLRGNGFQQISKDHCESQSSIGKKPGLTQYLGIDPEEMRLDPYIAKGKIRKGDIYLICSDGLTDLLSNSEIALILSENNEIDQCAEKLIEKALEFGGRDNVTVILCKVTG